MSLISYLTTIRFDFGALSGLGDDLRDLGIKAPLIIADEGIARAGLVDRLKTVLPAGQDVPVFTETPTNPTEEAVAGRARALSPSKVRRARSPSAAARRSISPRAWRCCPPMTGPLENYAAILGGIPKITSAVAPLIAIPTTAGTGSEVGRAALITLEDGRKLGFISPHLIPKRAICDPELTLGLPPAADRRDGHGCHHPLHRDLSQPALQPAGRGDRARRPGRAVDHIERAVKQGTPTARPATR